MSLKEKIKQDITTAMKEKKELELLVLRGVTAVVQNKEIEKKEELNDEEIVQVLMSEVKKRKDSIEQFKAGNRNDLVEKEEKELEILKIYLQPTFLLCVAVLGTASGRMAWVKSHEGIRIIKKPIPLKIPFDFMDETALFPYKVLGKQSITNKDVLETLEIISQHNAIILKKVDTNTWDIFGSLALV